MSGGKVAKNTAFLLTAYVGQKVLTFVYFTVIARLAGVEGSGRYFVAVSFAVIFSIFLDLGLGNVITRETARLKENASKLLANVLGVKLLLALVTVPATLIAAKLIGYEAETRTMIAVAAAVTVLDSFNLIFYGVMRGYQNLRYESIGIVTGQLITITVGSTALLLGFPLVFLVIALLCGSFWNFLWSARSLRRHYGLSFSCRLEPAMLRFIWGITAPFALAGIFSRIYSNVDSVMLSRMVSEHAVGLYGAAYKVVFAFMFLPTAFGAAIYPAMSEAYAHDRSRLGQIFSAALKYLLVVAAPLVAGIFALSKPIVLLVYGQPFAGAVLPLQVLIFSLGTAFLYWPVGALLNACDRQSRNTLVMGVTMTVNVVMNLLLIPHFEAIGAALAALVGNLVLFCGAMIASRGLTPVAWPKLLAAAARIIGSAVAMGVVVWGIRGIMPLPVTVVLGGLTYVALLIGSGGLSVKELRELINLFLRRNRSAAAPIE